LNLFYETQNYNYSFINNRIFYNNFNIVYSSFNRYSIISTDDAVAFKIDKKTGQASLIIAEKEHLVKRSD